ncbi:variable surface protein [Plasmodium gonderi]|uniref:Variable surface protein n=1 Tax=Plasmodium gonderi TaxID=77519 RepID=A0A1Y1JQJ0_PLAGO|nr:variable surface protein [Plasmodium gonderi]GAW84709.1 variable surface protein [Plasmodium gonderi]
MNDAQMYSNNFDYTGIFDACNNGFSWSLLTNRGGNNASNCTNLCSKFRNAVGITNEWKFFQLCQVLCLYLYHIKVKEQTDFDNRKSYCKCFHYKLKKNLLKKFGSNIHTTKEYYYEMINNSVDDSQKIISKICENHDVNIGEDTFKILENLDNIYDLIKEFYTPHNRGLSRVQSFERSMEYLEKYKDTMNESLYKELEKVFQIYKGYLTSWRDCRYGNSVLQYFKNKWKNRYTFRDTETSANTGINTISEKNTGAGADTRTEASAIIETSDSLGSTSGIIFFSFSIITIMFILYKYTNYGSFVKPRVRKLKSRFNKKKRYHQKLMDSFHETHHNLNYNDYQISYKSAN